MFYYSLLSITSRSRLLKKIADLGIIPIDGLKKVKYDSPIYSVIVVGVISFILTLIDLVDENSIEILASISNLFAFLVFFFINVTVIYRHHNKKRESNKYSEEEERDKFIEFLRNSYPVYSIFGSIFSFIFVIMCARQFYEKFIKK